MTGSEVRKRNKRHPGWKGRTENISVDILHGLIYRKS